MCFSQENTRFSETIIEEDLKQHMLVLASDSLEGRETGKPGQKMAADYIKSYFKSIGIPPYRRKKYYQKFIRQAVVIGYIQGTDLKNELIVISAHYDHLGKKDSLIFNGADDNASK